LVINTLLFRLFPDFAESTLTQYKIALVREETLARTAKAIELDKTIRV
jgi:dsRNA-specific ribonuclease